MRVGTATESGPTAAIYLALQGFPEGPRAGVLVLRRRVLARRYDNLKAAVNQVLRGRRREESDHLVALCSHYLYDSQSTLAGIAGAHEKGGVEGEVGRFAAATSGARP